MIFQGQTGYIALICEVHLQYGNSWNKMAVLHFFSSKFPSYIYSILYVHTLSDTAFKGGRSKSDNAFKVNWNYAFSSFSKSIFILAGSDLWSQIDLQGVPINMGIKWRLLSCIGDP